jgi:hypothetical protein
MNIPLSQYKRLLFLDRHGYFSRDDESFDHFLKFAPLLEGGQTPHFPYPPVLISVFWQKFLVDIRNIPMEEADQGIYPWEIACCIIDETGRASIKVRRKTSSVYSRVSKDAVLAHECVHALRGRLFSRKYEEIAAYAASEYLFPKDFPKWRTWLSPLFVSTTELVCSFVWMMGVFFASFVSDREFFPPLIFFVSLLPILFCIYRLHSRWTRWNKARKVLSSVTVKDIFPLLLRLTDEDIDWLSALSKEEAAEKIAKKAEGDWRWDFLKETFLMHGR